MKKKIFYLLVVVPVILMVAGCSSLQLPGTSANNNQQQSGQPVGQPGDMPIENKLAQGTLKLEGTSQAVTAEQAKTILPLWRAVKSLSSSSTASPQELSALYQQIQEAMTAEQIKTIKEMSMSPEDTQAMMTKYGVQANFPTMDPQMQATRQAQRSSNSSSGGNGGGPGGGFGGPGGPPPDGGGGFPGGAMGGQSGTQTTPQAGQTNNRPRMGMNTLWVDPLIKVLEQRAG